MKRRQAVYALYNTVGEIKYVGTVAEIAQMRGVSFNTAHAMCMNRQKKFEAFKVGYSDDNLED